MCLINLKKMIRGLFKFFPYLLIIMPIIGVFVDTSSPQWQAKYPIQELIKIPMNLPWWGKILCILLGIIWILMRQAQSKSDT